MAGHPQAARAAGAVGLVVVLVTAVVLLVARPWQSAPPSDRPATAGPSLPAQASEQPATVRPRPACAAVGQAFDPRSISVPGVTRAAAVITPPRDADGIPGTPPLTDQGKTEFAWDRALGPRPGDHRGNVVVNAHTWPDGSALGNRMLAHLHKGDRIVVRGGAGQRLCYRVTERFEVPAGSLVPRYYATRGKPRLAILACSGQRLGPGVWTRRTIWFASPVPA